MCQFDQHQMMYNFNENNDEQLRISYFDLKGFDDILTTKEMDERIGNIINHSFNVILLYYSIDERVSFLDDNGYSVQDIKLIVDKYLELVDRAKFFVILVGLKLDTENDGDRKVETSEAVKISKKWDCPFIEVSAKTGQNISDLLKLIAMVYMHKYDEIDGDLEEVMLFDETKALQKKKIREDDEYEEYKEEEEKKREWQEEEKG